MKMRGLVVVLSLMLITIGVGCVALSTRITPANNNEKAIAYVVESGIADANDFKAWYPNLEIAEKLKKAVDDAYEVKIQELQQKMEREDLTYSIHKDVVANDSKAGRDREELLFGEKGLASLGLSMMGFGTLTGFVGLMRKRPGDVTSQEMEQVVAQTVGTTANELSEKEKQLVEVVKGVQKFINTYRDTTDNKEAVMIKTLKELSSKAQDISTQVAVAKIKKEVLV